MTKLEKLYSIIENSREVGVKLSKDVLQQVEELEEGIIKEEILPALGNDIAPRLEPIKLHIGAITSSSATVDLYEAVGRIPALILL